MTTNLWRLGEADPGAVSGNAANATTVDSVGSDNLPLAGTGVTYTNAVGAPGSTLGVTLTGAGGYKGPVVLAGTEDNWGVQIWAKAANTNPIATALLYVGDTGTAGMGIYQAGPSWLVLYGGISFYAAAPLTVGVWTSLAVVVNSGVGTFYVNGVAVSPTFGVPNAVSGNVLIGQNKSGGDPFTGSLDEARVFTFTAGQFSPSDLLPAVAVPALSGWAISLFAASLAVSGLWLAYRRGIQ